MTKKKLMCDCSIIHERPVSEVLGAMPDKAYFERLSGFFKILGDDTRCRIIFALSMHELCVCDLSNILSMTKSSVSHQLAKMKECGAVKCRKEGKEVYYSLDDDHVRGIFDATSAHIAGCKKSNKSSEV